MDIKEILKAQSEAKEQPSESCIEGKYHDFRTFSHADGRDVYTWYFRCENCNEIIKKDYERTGEDKLYWQ